MASFRYVAIDPSGQVARGIMDAPNEAEVVARLQRAGNIPMRAEPAGGRLRTLLHTEVSRRGLTAR